MKVYILVESSYNSSSSPILYKTEDEGINVVRDKYIKLFMEETSDYIERTKYNIVESEFLIIKDEARKLDGHIVRAIVWYKYPFEDGDLETDYIRYDLYEQDLD